MEYRVIFRHRGGTKGSHEDQFKLEELKEILIGRDPSANVKFDEKEDLISRLHAKIVMESDAPLQFKIVDLKSRNGTMVNGVRVYGETRLNPGDTIQLGPGGAVFEFDVDPRPPRTTRMAERVEPPPTRPAEGEAVPTPVPPDVSAKQYVGKATLERTVREATEKVKKESTSRTLQITLALLALIVVIGGYLVYQKVYAPPTPPTPDQIAAANTDAVVYIEVGWKLVDVNSGAQLYHACLKRDSGVGGFGGGAVIPLFVRSEGKIEPLLAAGDGGGTNIAIGGRGTGSGFVVREDGFVITNRHVAAAWTLGYVWPADIPAGVLLDEDGTIDRTLTRSDLPRDWVPQKGVSSAESARFDPGRKRVIGRINRLKGADGRHDYLNVTFAKTKVRTKARLTRASDTHDVALIKVDLPQSLTRVEINPDYDSVRPGDVAISLAYPAISSSSEAVDIPEPTISTGDIARIHRAGQPITGLELAPLGIGDSYQLNIGTMGEGSSGGPVFDKWGRVIAVLYAGRTSLEAQARFAVPIRYAAEIMNISKVVP